MVNNIDDTTEEYASDLKKKIEEEKRKQQAKEESIFLDADIDDTAELEVEEKGPLDILKEMKDSYEEEDLETVEFEIQEQEKQIDLERTKVLTSNKDIPIEENMDDENLSPEQKKKNKMITIAMISLIVVALVGGTFAGIKLLGGKGKDDKVAEVDKTKDKNKDKNKDKDKDKDKDKEKDKEKENNDINEKEKAALEGYISSNNNSIATLESEITKLQETNATLGAKKDLAQSVATNVATLSELSTKVTMLPEDVESEEYEQAVGEINSSLANFGCVATGKTSGELNVAITSCVSQENVKVSSEFTQTVTSASALVNKLTADIAANDALIETKRSDIINRKNENSEYQSQLDALG